MNPVFFISSTIYDFKDLRSSIKWWLEQNDYSVNASEYNDFQKPLDNNSYDACLRAIDNSDYFILLIGDRIGGMYDDKTTITQKEYQYAYQRMLKGKIKIINFIRQDTWTKFNEYNKIIKKQKTKEESEEERQILHRFIDEVRRVEEMKLGKSPKSNWLHSFNGFSDIVEVIKQDLGGRVGLNYKLNRHLIIEEIQRNLKSILSKDDENDIFPIGFISTELFKDFKLDIDNPEVKLSNKQYINYGAFYISYWQFKGMRINRLESLYKSGFFLEYNTKKNDYEAGEINVLASRLINTYETINSLHSSLYKDSQEKIIRLSKKADNSHLIVKSVDIILAIKFYETIKNCINYSLNLYKALFDLKFEIPEHIQDLNRFPEGMLAKESTRINNDELDNFLKTSNNWQ